MHEATCQALYALLPCRIVPAGTRTYPADQSRPVQLPTPPDGPSRLPCCSCSTTAYPADSEAVGPSVCQQAAALARSDHCVEISGRQAATQRLGLSASSVIGAPDLDRPESRRKALDCGTDTRQRATWKAPANVCRNLAPKACMTTKGAIRRGKPPRCQPRAMALTQACSP